MIWVVLLVVAGGFAWFLLAPRRFQTLENIPAHVDKKLKTKSIIETTEDRREVRPIVQEAASQAGEIADPGQGGSSKPQGPS
ncbi:MAG TPA: hypothetical protein VD969_10310 [Symbiobacteriaceae bacterium]|nr:hypothetical protein [Symbiobacteriaceae bacterium]